MFNHQIYNSWCYGVNSSTRETCVVRLAQTTQRCFVVIGVSSAVKSRYEAVTFTAQDAPRSLRGPACVNSPVPKEARVSKDLFNVTRPFNSFL